MTARDILMAAGGASQEKQYVDDVFSTYLYGGSGAGQTINNGIDLAGKGGLVWIKSRVDATLGNYLFDTSRGTGYRLASNSTAVQSKIGTDGYLSEFTSTGFTLPSGYAGTNYNDAGYSPYVSWTFRKAPKFFDVVTYTGDGASNRVLNHSLGSTPGVVVIKCTSTTGDWWFTHRSIGADGSDDSSIRLNNTAGAVNYGIRSSTNSSTTFTLNGINNVAYANTSGQTYVAYLFAHDPSADGLIQCGSFTTNASGNATISLGWEPQFVLLKNATSTGGWVILDSMRGMPVGGADAQLYPHVPNAEASINTLDPTATGFNATGLTANVTFVYMAIRRPNKPPTTGTQVYNAITYSGAGLDKSTMTGVGFPPDTVFSQVRNTSGQNYVSDRLRSSTGAALVTSSNFAESTTNTGSFTWLMDGITYGGNINTTGSTYINRFFRRAPGFMDVVAYAGDAGFAVNIAHNLSVQPELVISKRKDSPNNWAVAVRLGANSWLTSNATGGFVLNSSAATTQTVGYDSYFTPTHFGPGFVGGGWESTNLIGGKYVAYLFASCPGISKVGSYTGNGGSQTINCGFTTGARFVLVKRTDAAGDWYVWDTARGIVAANDPHLSLNSTAAEVTTDDSIDPDASGFIVNQNSATNINVSGGQYIYLAIA